MATADWRQGVPDGVRSRFIFSLVEIIQPSAKLDLDSVASDTSLQQLIEHVNAIEADLFKRCTSRSMYYHSLAEEFYLVRFNMAYLNQTLTS